MKKFFFQIKRKVCEVIRRILCNTRAELNFKIDGCDITAVFAEKHNHEIVGILKEILVDNPHIRQEGEPEVKIKPKKKDKGAR